MLAILVAFILFCYYLFNYGQKLQDRRKKEIFLIACSIPLLIYTIFYANFVHNELIHPFIPTRTFPKRPSIMFYVSCYFLIGIPFLLLFLIGLNSFHAHGPSEITRYESSDLKYPRIKHETEENANRNSF